MTSAGLEVVVLVRVLDWCGSCGIGRVTDVGLLTRGVRGLWFRSPALGSILTSITATSSL